MPAPSPLAIVLILAILASIVGAWIWVILRLSLSLPVLPQSKPIVVPWGAGSVLAVVLFWFALNISVPTAYMSAIRPQPGDPNANQVAKVKDDLKPGEMMTLSAVSNTAILALVPLLLIAVAGARPRDFGLVGTGFPKQVARGVLFYPLLAPIVFGAMAMALLVWGRTKHPLEDAIAQDKSPGMKIVLVLAGVVLAPAAEELIFRGVLLGWLTRVALGVKKRSTHDSMMDGIDEFPPVPHPLEMVEIESPEGSFDAHLHDTAVQQADHNPFAQPVAAIAPVVFEPSPVGTWSLAIRLFAANVIVSLIFAALHGAVWPTPIPIFFLSLGLGFLYQRTGGILAPIALHMTFNGVSTTMMFLIADGGGGAPLGLFF
jgi:membrane protease YdiL (CAAX protease family)